MMQKKFQLEAFIFDFDGVLFDSEKLHLEALNETLRPLNLSVDPVIYLENYTGLTDNVIFPSMLKRANIALTEHEINLLIEKKIKLYQQAIHQHSNLPGIPGILNFLDWASHEISWFGICSNGSRAEVHSVLDRLEGGRVKPYFQKVTTREDVAQGKPSPEGYLSTAAYFGVDPKHCLVIEDTQHGLQAAKSAGMHAAGIATTHEPSFLTLADFADLGYPEIQRWLSSN